MNIFALHGFLGLPSDWDFIKPEFPINLYNFAHCDFWEFANQFNLIASKTSGNKILLGYSLGGRLAMHALLAQPQLWDAAILVSTHTGAANQQRHNENLLWAEKFRCDPWKSLIQEWNSQNTFRSSIALQRNEKDFDRFKLAQMLENWSAAKQENLNDKIQNVHIPILWIAGQNDQFYSQRAKDMHFSHPQSKIWIAPNAGHRVPWDISKLFIEQINLFKKELYANRY